MTRILLTGGTGFIGQYLAKELVSRGYDVIIASSNREKSKKLSESIPVTPIHFDLADLDPRKDYFEYFGRPTHLIHLAWEGLPNYKSSFHTDTNLPRHQLFLRNMLEGGLKDLTVTGTCLEYGMQDGELEETMEVHPQTSYAIAKDELRRTLEKWQPEMGFAFRWIRLFYMYGQGQNPNSLLSQLEKALDAGDAVFNMSGGEQVRDFLPVETVAANIADIAVQERIQGIVNCCSGNPVTVKEFVESYLKKKNKSIRLNTGYYPYPDYEPMRFWGSNAKLKKIINHE